jgi:hypothetical protein
MADYQATIRWQRQADEAFSDNRYSRAHFSGERQFRAH